MTYLSFARMLGTTIFIICGTVPAVTVSPPLAKYAIASSVMELTDSTRQDPFAPGHQRRRLMLSAFYPIGPKEECRPYIMRYMPPTTAAVYDTMYASLGLPNGTFESIDLSLCKDVGERTSEQMSSAIALFSPGLGDSRLIYSSMAASLASKDFVVITIDHPYDANIVEYPDGSFVLAANITTKKQIECDLAVRQEDVSFVVDQLRKCSVGQRLFEGAVEPSNLDNIVMYGHSLGGATVATAMLHDDRIIGGMNLDGTMFGPVVERGLDCPLMFFGHEDKNLSTDPSWASIWPRLTSTKVELSLAGSQHGTFTDFPFLAKALGLTRKMGPELRQLLGDIDGERVLEILSVYISTFFDFALGRSQTPIVRNSGKKFPEVDVLDNVGRGHCK